MPDIPIAKVTDFFVKPMVAGADLTDILKVGDKIHIKGHTTDIEMIVESLQIEHAKITKAKADDIVGIKVPDRVRKGDIIYKVIQ
jgi:translation elongation factor EF-1alpha